MIYRIVTYQLGYLNDFAVGKFQILFSVPQLQILQYRGKVLIQACQDLPLYWGMVPEELEADVAPDL